MSAITDLERKEQSLEDQLAVVRKSLEAARIAACGVAIDDIVRVTQGRRKGELGKVCEIDVSFKTGKPWLRAYFKVKSGEYGTLARSIYSDWEKV